MSFLDDILQVKLSSNEYVKEKHKKKQIYLHHTRPVMLVVKTRLTIGTMTPEVV